MEKAPASFVPDHMAASCPDRSNVFGSKPKTANFANCLGTIFLAATEDDGETSSTSSYSSSSTTSKMEEGPKETPAGTELAGAIN